VSHTIYYLLSRRPEALSGGLCAEIRRELDAARDESDAVPSSSQTTLGMDFAWRVPLSTMHQQTASSCKLYTTPGHPRTHDHAKFPRLDDRIPLPSGCAELFARKMGLQSGSPVRLDLESRTQGLRSAR